MERTDTAIARERKRRALEELLASRTIDRSDQLRAFLRYVCELEIEGKADQISEYSIGVNALGRGPSFVPVEDSIVRNRAHALRRKLQEYYATENPSADVILELPRGSYVPRWTERLHELAPAPDEVPVPEPVSKPVVATVRRGITWSWIAFVSGAALTLLLAWLVGPLRPGDRVDPLVREMWGPLVAKRSEVLLCLTAPPQLFVRKVPAPPGIGGKLEGGAALEDYYRRYGYLPPDGRLYMIPTWHSPLLGDSLAIATATRVLGLAEARYQVLTEQVTQAPNLLGRSAIVVGRPEYSPLIRRYLETGPLTVDVDPASRETAVIDRRSGKPVFLPERDPGGEPGIRVTFGLISVLPGAGPPGTDERLVIFSGTSSAGTHAAAEFFASPAGLVELRKRLGADRRDRYTAIIRAENERNLPMNERLAEVRLH